MHHFATDVLVIGGGGAGAMAAYEASKHGVKVTMVLKGFPERCGITIMAPGAIAGVGSWHEPGDSRDLHFLDTVRGGSFLNEQRLVRILVEEAPDLILELERIGALWQRKADGESYALRIDGGHSYPRCTFLEDRTGREMMRALFGEVKKRNINILSNTMILKLLKDESRVTGAVGLNLETGETVLLRAKTVILTCGGAGNLYLNTSNPTGATGDGYALALDAGAELMDMEFVQFYPLGFLFPNSLRGNLGALLYYVHLFNNKGERFMEKYDPERLELSTRDRVARAIYTEVKEGRGGPHGGVFADMTYHEPGFIAKMQPALYETYQKIGITPEKDRLEVAPTCHFFMGGVRVDENWQSSVPGLFVTGENAAGVHGANRLSQNALAELLVSGARAGKAAAKLAAEIGQAPVDPREAKTATELAGQMLSREDGIRPVTLRNRLRRLMWEKVAVIRSEASLRGALVELEVLKSQLESQALSLKSRHYNQELVEGLENYFLATVAQCVTKAALLRTESRGAHYREDYPAADNKRWLKHLTIRQKADDLTVQEIPVDLAEIKPEGGAL
ncbi:FAD-dependent oxidoreductase [Zhaonella formicivorans]|uniref:FAD-dependent oxidoreductase n=1 Tax=Zhaonella formicivorans TaxID=2528593 RepID=UPI0010D68E1D|nr:FAD-dependent oxidoreductase [Zhaonella formicivorans]